MNRGRLMATAIVGGLHLIASTAGPAQSHVGLHEIVGIGYSIRIAAPFTVAVNEGLQGYASVHGDVFQIACLSVATQGAGHVVRLSGFGKQREWGILINTGSLPHTWVAGGSRFPCQVDVNEIYFSGTGAFVVAG